MRPLSRRLPAAPLSPGLSAVAADTSTSDKVITSILTPAAKVKADCRMVETRFQGDECSQTHTDCVCWCLFGYQTWTHPLLSGHRGNVSSSEAEKVACGARFFIFRLNQRWFFKRFSCNTGFSNRTEKHLIICYNNQRRRKSYQGFLSGF